MGYFNASVDGPDLIDGLDLGAESSMDAEDLAVDDCADGEVVEDLSAVFPGIGVSVLPVDLIVESVDSGDLP